MNGRYFFDRHEVEPAPIAKDAEIAERLWTESEALLARSGFDAFCLLSCKCAGPKLVVASKIFVNDWATRSDSSD